MLLSDQRNVTVIISGMFQATFIKIIICILSRPTCPNQDKSLCQQSTTVIQDSPALTTGTKHH